MKKKKNPPNGFPVCDVEIEQTDAARSRADAPPEEGAIPSHKLADYLKAEKKAEKKAAKRSKKTAESEEDRV